MNLKNKTFLITGGTGSFGNAVLNRFLKTNIKEIRIFSRDEKKQYDLRKKVNDDRVKFYLGDIRNYSSVLEATSNVDFIFHAAALKQVPSCEFFPMEAVNTNILGADNITKAAEYSGVKKCIMLSTDKAVYPINAMGLSKSMMEKIMIAKSRSSKTIFCATRYGNVMGTRGSVIPLFVSQIEKGLPITITHKNMTRFLMSVDQSVDLVLYALKNAKRGDILVQKSPASTILNLVKGLEILLQKKTKIHNVGIRHGEKIHETLVSSQEMATVIEKKNFYIIPKDKRDLNYDKYFEKGLSEFKELSEYNSSNTYQLNSKEIAKLINKFKVLNSFIE
ncbi:polysaccharide biosynthesis protein [Candidatus Pelagibacter sp.]|jgi:UDP-glucose 4-epimerase|nr:polysaccharide biosynthesis protein [Candidatus Pelagibacter sp.]